MTSWPKRSSGVHGSKHVTLNLGSSSYNSRIMMKITSLCYYKETQRCCHLVTVLGLALLAGNINSNTAEKVEICNAEETRLSCGHNEIIMMTSAEYGRMEVGRCIPEDNDFMGCTNNVLELLDRWCSGRRECDIKVPNPELEKENTECLKVLRIYLHATYRCLSVDANCRSDKSNIRDTSEGLISSHVTDNKGCGTSRSPWIISAFPGQTIKLSLTDFSSVNEYSSKLISCPVVYGFIEERSIGINYTICGGRNRQMALYASKTNKLRVYILPRTDRSNGQFLLKYTVTGCPELSRPAHAWYKREGNEAVIGCESNDKQWRLTCSGNQWIGEIGNCSQPAVNVFSETPKHKTVHFSSTVIMTAIASCALVLTVVSVVSGVVYIKKYRMRQETKFLTKTYTTIERNAQTYYRPVVLDQSADANQIMSYPGQCACATLQMRDHGTDNTVPTSSLERQSLYSSIKST